MLPLSPVNQARWAKHIRRAGQSVGPQDQGRVNPKVRFPFTPTYSSWLNQVELWFAKIQRDLIAGDVFTSLTDLARKLRKYIRA